MSNNDLQHMFTIIFDASCAKEPIKLKKTDSTCFSLKKIKTNYPAVYPIFGDRLVL